MYHNYFLSFSLNVESHSTFLHYEVGRVSHFQEKNKARLFNLEAQRVLALKVHVMLMVLDT